jgi:diguanylate cyclase (GGDEF)-like protein
MSSRPRVRLLLRKAAVSCVVLLAVGLVAGAGVYLSSNQAAARESVLHVFDERAKLAAGLTGDTLLASDPKTREEARLTYAGPAAGLNAVLAESVNMSTTWLAVLDSDGTPIGVSSPSHLAQVASLRDNPGFHRAVQSGLIALGDIVTEKGAATVHAFQPYPAAGGTRVLVVPMAVADLAVLLRSTLNLTGSRSYVVDSAGRVIVASSDARIGATLPDNGAAAAAKRMDRGVVGDDYFVASPVSGSSWRSIVVTSRAALLAPVDSAARGAWLIFAAFATAVLLILVIGASTLISSTRLAHARLHDALTGLPSRSLFLEQTEAAITQQRRREPATGGPIAALFLDLDGFKPVNDTYGHAAGDALLQAVAQRLVAATRPEDYVSRFGGDEFLVLCRGLHEESDALAIAARIRADLTEPYEVDDHQVRIGVSIGIATLGQHADRAETLIKNADLALYRAKNNGRGRTERYTPDLVNA